ncbi:unnamed protein product, partial [Clonostachys solani]
SSTQENQEITIADGRFRIDYKIADGGFSRVYVGTDKTTNKQVAIKLEEVILLPRRDRTVELEGRLYPRLPRNSSPKLLWTGTTKGGFYDALVTDLLGPSLWNLFEYCRHPFSMDTVCNVAIQALNRLEGIHKKGIIHNDIKPGNLAMGSGKKGNFLYIIDYGLASTFSDIQHKERDSGGLVGTEHYAPLEAIRDRRTRSYRDDLESLGLSLVELAESKLPWESVRRSKRLDLREKLTLDKLCGGLPAVKFLLEHARRLRFDQLPNYRQLIKEFERARSKLEPGQTWVFDWVDKRYKAMQKKMQERAASTQSRRRSRDEDDEGEEEAPPRRRRRLQ